MPWQHQQIVRICNSPAQKKYLRRRWLMPGRLYPSDPSSSRTVATATRQSAGDIIAALKHNSRGCEVSLLYVMSTEAIPATDIS